MPRKLNIFSNGGFIEFDSGTFDDWCVYITKPSGERFAPTDSQYFSRMDKLGKKHGSHSIYDDFVVIFNRTTMDVNPEIFQLIENLSHFYKKDALEIEIWFNV